MRNIDENEVLRDALSGLNEDVPPMPEGLHAAWLQKVEEEAMEASRPQKLQTMRTLTRWLSVAAAMVFVIGGTLLTKDSLSSLTGADQKSAQNESGTMFSLFDTAIANNSYVYGAEAAEEEYAMDTGLMLTAKARGAEADNAVPTSNTSAAFTTEKKIIRTASMTIATQTYESSLAALKSACDSQGGWIEQASESVNSYSGLRTAYLTLRVPQTGLDSYLAVTGELGRITARSETATDVTESYQDTQTRLNTQIALMERLQALINESGDLSDLLALESQIAETQYQIDRLQSSLNSTNRQVAYSTVDITLREEKTVELTDNTVTFGERIVSAIQVGLESLGSFLGDMVVFLVAAFPFIVIVVIAGVIIRLVVKRRRK